MQRLRIHKSRIRHNTEEMQDGRRPLGRLRPRRTGTCDTSVIVTDAGKAVDPRSVM